MCAISLWHPQQWQDSKGLEEGKGETSYQPNEAVWDDTSLGRKCLVCAGKAELHCMGIRMGRAHVAA